MTSPVTEVERWSALKVWLFSLFNRNPESNFAAVDRIGLEPDDRFVDLGCGLGAALEHAATTGAKTAGIDPSPSMVERAAERVPQADVRLGSAESIPFENEAFTAAISVSTYHHCGCRDGTTGGATSSRPWRTIAHRGEKLKRGAGHGLDDVGGESLAQLLETSGYASVEVETIKIGRAE